LAESNHGYGFRSIRYDGSSYRVITEGGFVAPDGTPLALQIARPLSDIQHSLADLRNILWLVAFSGIAVAVGLGYLIGRATIRPVERLTAAAEHVAATQELDAKIDDDGDDELARLAKTFNSMLQALAASRSQQAQLISDAGHELRTPLTSLRTNIEVLMRVPDLPTADRAALIADIEAQLAELTTLVGDVVDLAREEEQKSEPIEVRLDSLVERAVERARRRAPGVDFDVDLTAGSVRAHPALLERAILNVLDNAVKWSPPGGRVGVWLQRGAYWALDIRDQGPGISPIDLPKVFDRFYRAETARALPGSGLGLAIVKQVVTSHGGSVTASCPPGVGTLIHIELPVVAEQEMDPKAPEQTVASLPYS
jgi:two-component system sensor histidine kinase MprB